LSNADFAAGRLNFTQQAGAGGIVNQGVIRTASGGLVALVAPNVENHGVIQAPNGDVILAAGKSANLVDLQRPQIQVEVNAADNQALNVGQLVGRNIGIYAGAIRHSGIANANPRRWTSRGEWCSRRWATRWCLARSKPAIRPVPAGASRFSATASVCSTAPASMPRG
jgi:hypothetical protein